MTVRLYLKLKQKRGEIWPRQTSFEREEINGIFLYGKEGEVERESSSMLLLNNMNPSYESPTSSPPTPPSPLPISFGPGNRRYSFSASSTPSPPFSPAPSSHTSAEPEKLPLLQEDRPSPNVPSVFSLDRQKSQELEPKSTCLQDLLEWFIQRCCSCCTRFFEFSNRDITS